MREEPWVAHEAPDRPFDAWMWLDDCKACTQALAREAIDRPRLVFCLKTSADRINVTAEYLHKTLATGESFDSLCYVDDDWVREVFVVNGSLPPTVDWQSLTLHEELEESGPISNGR
jgi:hypothetical protein